MPSCVMCLPQLAPQVLARWTCPLPWLRGMRNSRQVATIVFGMSSLAWTCQSQVCLLLFYGLDLNRHSRVGALYLLAKHGVMLYRQHGWEQHLHPR